MNNEKKPADPEFLSQLEKRSQKRIRLYRTRLVKDEGESESYPLDHNHTHFILLDDQFGEGDKEWRAKCKKPLRADLILRMRAQIEQESRKVTQQGKRKFYEGS